MKNHLRRLALLCGAALAVAASATAAFASSTATTSMGEICAVIVDNTGKRIEINLTVSGDVAVEVTGR